MSLSGEESSAVLVEQILGRGGCPREPASSLSGLSGLLESGFGEGPGYNKGGAGESLLLQHCTSSYIVCYSGPRDRPGVWHSS